MSSIEYSDFSVEPGEKDNNLRLNRSGCCAVLIGKSDNDESLRVRAMLGKLSIQNLDKLYLDIQRNNNRKILTDSKNTITPITDIPTLFFFVDGKIRAFYTKKADINILSQWFREKMAKFSNSGPRMPMNSDRLPERQRQDVKNFSISTQTKESPDVGVPVGVNAAWRLER